MEPACIRSMTFENLAALTGKRTLAFGSGLNVILGTSQHNAAMLAGLSTGLNVIVASPPYSADFTSALLKDRSRR